MGKYLKILDSIYFRMMINMISLPVNYETTGMVKESRSGRSDNKTHDKNTGTS
jgi:hypothetical protein